MEGTTKDKRPPRKDNRREDRTTDRQGRRRSRSPRADGRSNLTADRYDTNIARTRSDEPPRGPKGHTERQPQLNTRERSDRRSRSPHDRRKTNRDSERSKPLDTITMDVDQKEEPSKYALDMDPDELKQFLGFSSFSTTKETKVPGNEFNYGVYKVQAAQYRQYMNRKGGFNRPLSPSRGKRFAKPADTDGI